MTSDATPDATAVGARPVPASPAPSRSGALAIAFAVGVPLIVVGVFFLFAPSFFAHLQPPGAPAHQAQQASPGRALLITTGGVFTTLYGIFGTVALASLFHAFVLFAATLFCITKPSRAKAKLRAKGYDWVTARDAKALGIRLGFGFDWVDKLPRRDDVAATPIYLDDSIKSLAACAEIIRERSAEDR